MLLLVVFFLLFVVVVLLLVVNRHDGEGDMALAGPRERLVVEILEHVLEAGKCLPGFNAHLAAAQIRDLAAPDQEKSTRNVEEREKEKREKKKRRNQDLVGAHHTALDHGQRVVSGVALASPQDERAHRRHGGPGKALLGDLPRDGHRQPVPQKVVLAHGRRGKKSG